MTDITKENSPYFFQAKRYYRIAWYILLGMLVFTQIAKPLHIPDTISSLLVSVAFFTFLYFTISGIASIVNSYTKKETANKYRPFYLFGFILFLAPVFFMIIDIVRLFSKI